MKAERLIFELESRISSAPAQRMDDIDYAIDKSNPESAESWEKLGRSSFPYSTVLFGVSSSKAGDVLNLAGTGTFVSHEQEHYILTARHVWEEKLKSTDKIGITLREKWDHQCLIDTATLVVSGPPKPRDRPEWGPDIALVRIPSVRVGEINAFKAFYPLSFPEKSLGNYNESHLLVGTPYELGQFEPNHASVQVLSLWDTNPTTHTKNGYDYIDFEPRLKPGMKINHFGGVSGGGLWKVRIYINPQTGKIDSDATLRGVAFYQLEGKPMIRCHGPESIQRLLEEW